MTSLESLLQNIEVVAKPHGFDDWDGMLALLREAFAYLERRIDPASSLHSFDAAKLAAKAGIPATRAQPT